jgi:hypothetical protein
LSLYSLIGRETMCQYSCSVALVVVLLPVYRAVTWQWLNMSKYLLSRYKWSGVEWSRICDPRSVSQYVLVSGHPLGPMTRFYMFFGLTCTCFIMSGALSDERTGLYFAMHVTHLSELRWTRNHVLQSHLRLTQPGGPGPHIYIPRNRVAQLYHQALGSIFVASYDSQGYGRGIVTCLHTDRQIMVLLLTKYNSTCPSTHAHTVKTL